MTSNNRKVAVPFKLAGTSAEAVAMGMLIHLVKNPKRLNKVLYEEPEIVELNHISAVLTKYQYKLYDELEAKINTLKEDGWTDQHWRDATVDLATRIGMAVIANQDLIHKLLYEKGVRFKE